jgi:hypothetical protein
MIRRVPTLIQMTDTDVQDVRDMMAQQKAELANSGSTREDVEMFDRMNKANRLGLDSGIGMFYTFPTSAELTMTVRFIYGVIMNILCKSHIYCSVNIGWPERFYYIRVT